MERRRLTDGADIRLFSTDLDGTLLGEPEATWRFAATWSGLPAGVRPLLVYNTGRSIADTQAVIAARGLPEPDYIIGGLGTELHDSLYQRADEFRARFNREWNHAAVERIVGTVRGIRRQPGVLTHGRKSSWYWAQARPDEIDALCRQLREAEPEVLVIYSCHYFLDVVPAWAGKGNALAWLCTRLGIPFDRVLVAGDSGNDTEMFRLPNVNGIVVQNALPELQSAAERRNLFVAQYPMADGVLEGLRHFGVLTDDQPRMEPATAEETV